MNILRIVPKDKHDENLRRAAKLGEWKESQRVCADDVIRAAQNGDRNARLLLDLLLTNAYDSGWRDR